MARPSPAVFELLERLIAFDTTSHLSNLQIIEFIQTYLKQFDIASTLVPSEDGKKANIYASIGPRVEGGVVLSGHTDVVPVEGQDWNSSPFEMAERDGRLYGRGTCDMKGFVATALAMVPKFKEANLSRPIHLAFSYDEEVGCKGAPAMIRRIASELPKPLAVIVGEPTEMRPVNGHKGICNVHTHVKGHAAHSSQIQLGASAVMAAGELISYLNGMSEEMAATAKTESGFVPAHSTLTVNVISGGTAPNIMAQDCHFDWDLRMLPGEDPLPLIEKFKAFAHGEVLPKMREKAPDTDIIITNDILVPPFAPESDSVAEALVRRLTGANQTHQVSFGTEAGQFQNQGFSVIVCGPGSIAQAHQPNEFVSLDQLHQCESLLHKLIAELK
ncbi:MAG: acetylornithine deacetylase [Sphingomonadales bacterium]|jgi:acetylornithine deacetylase